MPQTIFSHKKFNTIALNALASRRYRSAYQLFKTEFGIDIPSQSTKNMRRLYEELKLRKFLPEKEQESYGDKLYSHEEAMLFDTWKNAIVPLFTLKHGAKKINFEELTPITTRQQKGETVNNANTFAFNALRSFSYFVLGIGDNHATPNFLGTDIDTIIFELGKLNATEQRVIQGLWISGHVSEYFRSSKLNPLLLGSTSRSITFSADDLSKTYTYRRQDGVIIQRKLHYADEIFSADKNVNIIFDALFQQFIIELRCIGGDFQQHIYQNASNVTLISDAFHLLFPSWVYPEAKLPLQLSLNNAHVKLLTRSLADASHIAHLRQQWFQAVDDEDVTQMEECLKSASQISFDLLNSVDNFNNNALTTLLDDGTKKNQAIDFLLQHGININHKNILGSVLDIAIQKGNLNLAKIFAEIGVPHSKLPFVKQIIPYSESSLKYAVEKSHLEIIEYLLNLNITIPFNYPLVSKIYLHIDPKLRENLIEKVLKLGFDLDAFDGNGKTALMYASNIGDLQSVKFFIAKGACIDLGINKNYETAKSQGKTALHLAVVNGHKEVVDYLITQGANVEHKDASDNTPYFALLDKLEGGVAHYILENKDQVEKLYSAHQVFGTENIEEAIAHSFTKEWQELEEKLISVKKLLESYNINLQRPVKNSAPEYSQKESISAAMVTGEYEGEPAVVLVRKKDKFTLGAYGYYLFPGGYKDESDESDQSAARRELLEETGLAISDQQPMNIIFTSSRINKSKNKNILREIKIIHIDLGANLCKHQLVPRDDIAEVKIVKWSEIKKVIFNEKPGYFYKSIRLNQSNALLAGSILTHQPIPHEAVKEAFDLELGGGEQRLYQAIIANRQEEIISLYQEGIDLNKTQGLICAISLKKQDMVDLQLKLGADVNLISNSTNQMGTPLIEAVKTGNLAMVIHLIENHNADMNFAFKGFSALYVACFLNNLPIVNYLLTKGISLSQGLGGSALISSLMTENLELASLLLETGQIDLNQTYALGPTNFSPCEFPLLLAIRKNLPEFVKLFLAKGADIYLIQQADKSIFHLLKFLLKDYKMRQMHTDELMQQFNDPDKNNKSLIPYNARSVNFFVEVLQRDLPDHSNLKLIAALILAAAKNSPNPAFQKDIAMLEKYMENLDSPYQENDMGLFF